MSFSLNRIKPILFNIPGWHTKRKIIVIESDDWGSVRVPSKEIYNCLLSQGYAIDKSPYGKDSLESNDDISALIEILSSIKNRNGQNPIFTLNNIVTNPDFDSIYNANFNEYYYELFIETYKRYPRHNNSFDLIKEGIDRKLFRPQLHGREHINTARWLRVLQSGSGETMQLFKKSMPGLPISLTRESRNDFQRALDFDTENEALKRCESIYEGCNIFNSIWGFKSVSFIAPNFFWDDEIEKCLYRNEINILQGQRGQMVTNQSGTYKSKYHYTGQTNNLGQIYLVRNCYFEPTFDPTKDWVVSCLREMADVFLLRKPAIISTHRVNYIGGIDPANRERGLKDLSQLLRDMLKTWPEIEFMTSDQLGSLIINDLKA